MASRNRNKLLTVLIVAGRLVRFPFMVLIIVWWDFRCRWLGWHSYRPTWRLMWNDRDIAPRYWRYEEVCRNFDCRAVHLGTERLFRWRPEMGDGPYPLGPDGKEMRRPTDGQ